MKHYGDITKLNGYELPVVDIITGGSPCQDLSVAGKRAGLAGERSGLFMEQIRLIKEMRDGYIRQLRGRGADVDIRHIRPRYMVWENVPGAFSSNGGADFKAVLEETAKVADENAVIPGLAPKQKWTPAGAIMGDGWSIAWRVHDAQFWGVLQRRKRIALVADFGGATAPEILFERKSVSGNIEESGEAWQGTTADVERSVDKAIVKEVYCLQGNGIDRADTAKCNGKGWRENQSYTLNTIDRPAVSYQKTTGTEYHAVAVENHPNDSRVKISEDGKVQTLSSRMGTGGGNVPMVMYPEKTTQEALNGMYEVEGSAWDGSQVSPTLTANNANGAQRMPDKDNFNAVIAYGVDAYNQTQTEEQTKTLNSAATDSDHIPCVYGLDRAAFNQGKNAKFGFSIDEEKVGAQVARGPGAVCQSVVRRLTPLECERLQGFPDGWTDIGEWIDSKGEKHKDADSPRYKALGNSIALPFWQWMAARMVRNIDHEPTMASLFDGIGGFPLVFSRCGCKPIWASEIEEFPIAVTKKRFGAPTIIGADAGVKSTIKR